MEIVVKRKNVFLKIKLDLKTKNRLASYAQMVNKPVEIVACELIKDAFTLKDDLYWSQLANQAETEAQGKPLINAEVVWGK